MHVYNLIIKGWSSVNPTAFAYISHNRNAQKVSQYVQKCMDCCPPEGNSINGLAHRISRRHNVDLEVKDLGPLGDCETFIVKSKDESERGKKAIDDFITELPTISGSGEKVLNGTVAVLL